MRSETKGETGHAGKVWDVAVAAIHPNPDQPRKHFEAAALRELAESLREHGMLQPMVVRPLLTVGTAGGADEQYQIIAGERRFRAALLCGWETVPCLIRYADDLVTRELAVLENCARQDMRPTETARAYQTLLESGDTVEEIARKVGVSVASVRQHLQVLRCTTAAQYLFDTNRVPWRICTELAHLSEAGQEEALTAILRQGAGLVRAQHLCRMIGAREQQMPLLCEAHQPTREELDARERYDRAMKTLTETLALLANTSLLELAVAALATPAIEEERLRLIVAETHRVQCRFAQARAERDRAEGGLTPATLRSLAGKRAAATRKRSA